MSRGKFTFTREDGAIVTHCGGTAVKNTHSGDYFFTKGEYCGVCKKSKKANRQNLLICPGCWVARYCSKACQQQDFEDHKIDCENVAHYLEMKPKIEAKFVKWNWNEHQVIPEGREHRGFELLPPPKRDRPENLFKTILGQFCSYSNINNVQLSPRASLAAKLEDVWPREYIKRRMRCAEAMWEIAYKHESYEATEKVFLYLYIYFFIQSTLTDFLKDSNKENY